MNGFCANNHIPRYLMVFIGVFLFSRVVVGMPVFDAANFAQNLISALRLIESVSKQTLQIRAEYDQIKNQLETLDTLDAGTFNEFISLMDQNAAAIQNLTNSVQGIKYSVQAVNGQFDGIFPKDSDWDDGKLSDIQNYIGGWNEQINTSARDAMMAQSVLSNLKSNNNKVRGILQRSQNAGGEVRQLQSVNQMLSVMSSQLNDFSQVMVTTNRVMVSSLAASASEREASRMAAKRAMRNFGQTNDEPPAFTEPPKMNE